MGSLRGGPKARYTGTLAPALSLPPPTNLIWYLIHTHVSQHTDVHLLFLTILRQRFHALDSRVSCHPALSWAIALSNVASSLTSACSLAASAEAEPEGGEKRQRF